MTLNAVLPPVRIPLAAPNISPADRQAMCKALIDSTIAYGPTVTAFEDDISELVGHPHAVALQSGTAALHLAMIVSGVSYGDEVLMPTLTYVAPANAVRYVGAHPVFLDVEPRFGQLDVERARKFVKREYRETDGELRNRRSGRRLKALVAIDLLGHPCPLDRISELTKEFGLALIDDNAEAFGAEIEGRPAASLAPVSVLSFNANKIITTGGGGMLLCHDEDMANHARSLASHAKAPGSALYEHGEVGFNYRMATAQAALGRSQLRRFKEFLNRKREIAELYTRAFGEQPAITVPAQADWALASYWLYTIHVPAESRAAIVKELAEIGIQTRPIFRPMHRVKAHAKAQADDCPVAETLSATGLSLPCSTSITDLKVDEVAQAVHAALAESH